MSALPPPSFLTIVQLHHLQAMLHLGMLPNPATGKPNPVDLVRARHELALLQILEEKTRGNLDADETELIESILTALSNAIDAHQS